MRIRYSILFFFITCVFSCESERADEALKSEIVGTWECSLINEGEKNYTPENDSTRFYLQGKRIQLSFSRRNFLNKTGEKLNSSTYFIFDGDLMIIEEKDTSVSEIIFLEKDKLVLKQGEVKKYYDRFIY